MFVQRIVIRKGCFAMLNDTVFGEADINGPKEPKMVGPKEQVFCHYYIITIFTIIISLPFLPLLYQRLINIKMMFYNRNNNN